MISNVSCDPNYFNPFSNTCLPHGNEIKICFELSEDVKSVTLRVFGLRTGKDIKVIKKYNLDAGENCIYWDGTDSEGKFLDVQDYQLFLTATDHDGNSSLLRAVGLVRIAY